MDNGRTRRDRYGTRGGDFLAVVVWARGRRRRVPRRARCRDALRACDREPARTRVQPNRARTAARVACARTARRGPRRTRAASAPAPQPANTGRIGVPDVSSLAPTDALIAREQDAAPSRPSGIRELWLLLALAAGAVAVALISRHLIYPAFSWNRDEATYFWQTDVLRAGKVFAPVGNPSQFFWPWLAGVRNAGFFSQYTVGWPMVLLVTKVVLGSA